MIRLIAAIFVCCPELSAAAGVLASDAAKPQPAETHALLDSSCPGKSYIKGKETGCSVCPEGGNGGWSLAAVYFGRFVSSETENALLATQGCEPHVNDFGGTVLLARQGPQWRLLGYYPGIITASCHKLKSRAAHELLICLGDHTGQGVTDSVIYSLDFAAPKEKVMNLIFTAEDTTSACAARVRKATIEKVTFTETGNISISARLGSTTLSTAQQERCLDHPESIQPTTREYRIGYLFDGEHFTLSPTSAGAARLFSPEP